MEGLRLRVLGLCKVSSLQRNTTKKKKESRRGVRPRKSLESQTVEAEV